MRRALIGYLAALAVVFIGIGIALPAIQEWRQKGFIGHGVLLALGIALALFGLVSACFGVAKFRRRAS